MTAEEKKAAKVKDLNTLPTSVEEARRLLAQNIVLREVLGDEFVDRNISANKVSLPHSLFRLTIADLHYSFLANSWRNQPSKELWGTLQRFISLGRAVALLSCAIIGKYAVWYNDSELYYLV